MTNEYVILFLVFIIVSEDNIYGIFSDYFVHHSYNFTEHNLLSSHKTLNKFFLLISRPLNDHSGQLFNGFKSDKV